MTDPQVLNAEFSEEFDIVYNSITSNQAPGLDEYEKSVFLTQAQLDIIDAYFSSKKNKVQEGFDDSRERQIDFSNLIEEEEVDITPNNSYRVDITVDGDIFRILNERLLVGDKTLVIIPITYLEYDRLQSKPFKYPLKGQAWRIGTKDATIIYGPNYKPDKYVVRYVKRPTPIILTDIGDLTIEGEHTPIACQLDPSIHHDVIRRACELAKAVYVGDLNTQIALGTSSQTDLGVLQQRDSRRRNDYE